MKESSKQIISSFYEKLPSSVRSAAASEAQLAAFEEDHGLIPHDYRWFLGACGGGPIGDEWLDNIEELIEDNNKYKKECSDPSGWTMKNVFIMAFDGAGNPLAICRETGQVKTEDHDYGGILVLATSLEEYLLKKVGAI